MKIIGVNNQINIIKPNKNVSKPTFKSAQSAEHYAIELMKIDSSNRAKTIIGINKKLLPVQEVRDFIAGFLNGVKNSKGNQYEKDRILRKLQYNFHNFVYKDGWYFRTEEEELNAHKVKCSFSDIADNNGNITENAMDMAVTLSEIQGADHHLPEYLAASKDSDGSIDSHVGYTVKKIIDSLGDWHGRSVFRYAVYRDENKNVNKKFIDAVYKAPDGKIGYVINHFGLKTQEEVFVEHSKENLYLPENFYKLLQSLNENRLIYSNEASILDKEIGDYGKLLFILPDIPRTEENKEAYDKIIRFISSINDYKFDFNQKDKNGISFMEKVLNSENTELVNLVKKLKKKDIVYYPELDWAYKGIQNEEFRKTVDENLEFKFESLEKAAELRSIRALIKLAPQLDSPLCKKDKMIVKLWNIAKSQSTGVDSIYNFGKYLCDTFWEDLPEKELFSILEHIQQ